MRMHGAGFPAPCFYVRDGRKPFRRRGADCGPATFRRLSRCDLGFLPRREDATRPRVCAMMAGVVTSDRFVHERGLLSPKKCRDPIEMERWWRAPGGGVPLPVVSGIGRSSCMTGPGGNAPGVAGAFLPVYIGLGAVPASFGPAEGGSVSVSRCMKSVRVGKANSRPASSKEARIAMFISDVVSRILPCFSM